MQVAHLHWMSNQLATALGPDLIDGLVVLAVGNRHESADICTPHLLIVDCDGLPTKEWIDAQQARINEVLADYYIKHGIS